MRPKLATEEGSALISCHFKNFESLWISVLKLAKLAICDQKKLFAKIYEERLEFLLTK